MTPDIEGLKSYIGGLVLDVFTAKGHLTEATRMLAERDAKIAEMMKAQPPVRPDPLGQIGRDDL